MINKIQTSMHTGNIFSVKNQANTSFGFAALNNIGKRTSDSFGYKHNKFLNPKMFKKQGIFESSMLSVKLSKGENFVDICSEYGCTNNAKTNADFIINQILCSKSRAAIGDLSDEDYGQGLISLYTANYDNPQLSYKHTKALLDMIQGFMNEDDFVRYSGILEVGTK